MKFLNKILLVSLLLAFYQPSQAIGPQIKRIVIDAGHGGKDPGAIGKLTREKNLTLALALKTGELIKKNMPGVEVIYTRKDDRFVDLIDRTAIANKAKADLFVSIHINASTSKTPYGSSTYVLGLHRSSDNLDVAMRENAVITYENDYKQRYEGFDPKSTESYIIFNFIQNAHLKQSMNLASLVQKHFRTSAKRKDLGVHQAGFLVIRETSMPSVLIETGFISNIAEEKYMISASGQETLAESIYKAIKEYKTLYEGKSVLNEKKSVDEIFYAAESADSVVEDQDSDLVDSVGADVESGLQTADSKIIYKLQVYAWPHKLSVNDRKFKGVKGIECYQDGKLYKYTIGNTSSEEEITAIKRKYVRIFPDAFIVPFVNDNRITLEEARKQGSKL